MPRTPFPFAAIVGQDDMKMALLIAAVDTGVGGVLVFGDRGTGKSTAIRALAALLPPMKVATAAATTATRPPGRMVRRMPDAARARRSVAAPVPVVDLPLGATEDRVVGALDLERALTAAARRASSPACWPRANRGFLYIDEVNLLEDHLVDLLLDVAASGENVVEREGISVRAPRALCARRQRQPGRGRAAAAAARPVRPAVRWLPRTICRPASWSCGGATASSAIPTDSAESGTAADRIRRQIVAGAARLPR